MGKNSKAAGKSPEQQAWTFAIDEYESAYTKPEIIAESMSFRSESGWELVSYRSIGKGRMHIVWRRANLQARRAKKR